MKKSLVDGSCLIYERSKLRVPSGMVITPVSMVHNLVCERFPSFIGRPSGRSPQEENSDMEDVEEWPEEARKPCHR